MSLTIADKVYIEETVTNTVVAAIEALVLPHFDALYKRFDRLEKRMDKLEDRVSILEHQMVEVLKRFDRLAHV